MKTVEFLGLNLKLRKLNNKGQMAIESVLLMVVLLGAFMVVTNYAKKNNILAKLVQPPIQSLAVMVGYGVWKDAGGGCKAPGSSRVSIGKCHPNSIARSLSSDPHL